MRPSLLKMNPEPMADLTRFMTLKGSMDPVEMNTTDGETCLKSSGIDLAQLELAFNSGITNPRLIMHKKIEYNRILMLFILIPLR